MGTRSQTAIPPDLRIGFILQPGFTLLAFSGFMDVLRHAADESDQSRQIYCTWSILGDLEVTVTSSSGLKVHHDTPYSTVDPAALDYVVVVGGLVSQADRLDVEAYAFLRAARAAGTGIISLCTGFLHLIRADLLSGKRCCVHWAYEEMLKEQHPDVIPKLGGAYVEDDGLFTALGGIAGMELALDLIERHCGRRRSRKCMDRLCIDSTFSSRRPPTAVDKQLEVSGNRYLERAVEAMREKIDGGHGVSRLARKLGITDRQLRSIFQQYTGKSPGQFWRDIRLHEARWRLASTAESVTEIAYATGFSDAGHLSRSFRTMFGTSPRRYRMLRVAADSPAAHS